MRHYDWPRLKREYIEGYEQEDGNADYPTYDSLAAKYSLDKSTIARRGVKEGWPKERKAFEAKINQRYLEKRAKDRAKIADELDGKCLSLTRVCLTHINILVQTLQDNLRETGQPIDAKTLEAIGRALERYQRIGKISLGQYIGQTSQPDKPLDDGFLESLKEAVPEIWKND